MNQQRPASGLRLAAASALGGGGRPASAPRPAGSQSDDLIDSMVRLQSSTHARMQQVEAAVQQQAMQQQAVLKTLQDMQQAFAQQAQAQAQANPGQQAMMAKLDQLMAKMDQHTQWQRETDARVGRLEGAHADTAQRISEVQAQTLQHFQQGAAREADTQAKLAEALQELYQLKQNVARMHQGIQQVRLESMLGAQKATTFATGTHCMAVVWLADTQLNSSSTPEAVAKAAGVDVRSIASVQPMSTKAGAALLVRTREPRGRKQLVESLQHRGARARAFVGKEQLELRGATIRFLKAAEQLQASGAGANCLRDVEFAMHRDLPCVRVRGADTEFWPYPLHKHMALSSATPLSDPPTNMVAEQIMQTVVDSMGAGQPIPHTAVAGKQQRQQAGQQRGNTPQPPGPPGSPRTQERQRQQQQQQKQRQPPPPRGRPGATSPPKRQGAAPGPKEVRGSPPKRTSAEGVQSQAGSRSPTSPRSPPLAQQRQQSFAQAVAGGSAAAAAANGGTGGSRPAQQAAGTKAGRREEAAAGGSAETAAAAGQHGTPNERPRKQVAQSTGADEMDMQLPQQDNSGADLMQALLASKKAGMAALREQAQAIQREAREGAGRKAPSRSAGGTQQSPPRSGGGGPPPRGQ
jgi:hypothetical protein